MNKLCGVYININETETKKKNTHTQNKQLKTSAGRQHAVLILCNYSFYSYIYFVFT